MVKTMNPEETRAWKKAHAPITDEDVSFFMEGCKEAAKYGDIDWLNKDANFMLRLMQCAGIPHDAIIIALMREHPNAGYRGKRKIGEETMYRLWNRFVDASEEE